jgi:glycosyltransferase involved in cell wall biosynthesis
MSPSPEQRRSRRIPIAYKVRLVVEDQLISFASALNLSMSGILLSGPGRLPVGSQCGVAILLADGGSGRRVVARGTVVRNDAQGMAIAFSRALDRSSEESLRALIHSLDPEAEGPARDPRREVIDAGS